MWLARKVPLRIGCISMAILRKWMLMQCYAVISWLVQRFVEAVPSADPIEHAMVKRILIVRNDRIGDFVMSSALIREVRYLFPKSHIALVVNPASKGLAERCPHVDEVFSFASGRTIPGLRRLCEFWYAYRFARDHVATAGFDLAIVPRWDVDTYGASAVAYFSRARWRLGFSENVNAGKSLFNRGYNCFFTHVIESNSACHEVERSFALIRNLGGNIIDSRLECWTNGADKDFAQRHVGRFVHEERLLVALGPGASEPPKRWSIANFVSLAQRLQQELCAVVVLLGGPEERRFGEAIASGLTGETVNLIGRTTLPQAAAVLQHCDIFVGNDSGPMHLAAAAYIPVVMISCHPQDGDIGAARSPGRFGPWMVVSEILRPRHSQPPCLGSCHAPVAHCILGVTVDEVVAAVHRIVNRSASGGPARAAHTVAAAAYR